MAVGWNSGKGGVPKKENVFEMVFKDITIIRDKTRSSWLNCALRDDEAVYWVSIGHYEAVAVGN